MNLNTDTLINTVIPNNNNIQINSNSSNEVKVNKSSDNSSLSEIANQNSTAQNNLGEKVKEKAVGKAVNDVNKQLKNYNAECEFSVHKATGQITVKVVDKQTGDVIREIPPEKILDMVATALEMAGILIDEKG